MNKTLVTRVVCGMALALSAASPCVATNKLDIDEGLKTLPLLINKITGDITVAIVFDPAIAASQQDAQGLKTIIDSGMALPGGGKLSALLVSVGELGKLSRAQVAFITPGLSAHFNEISIAASAASLLTISTDLACVDAAKCIIGIATSPNINVYYSKTAADAAKIEFSQAFAMLVKER